MKGQRGLTGVELIVSVLLASLIALGGSGIIISTLRFSTRSSDRLVAAAQSENAGFWISRDAEMAEEITTDNMTFPYFVLMSWREMDYVAGGSIMHSAAYSYQNLVNGVGELKRQHWTSTGGNSTTVVARNIYYDPGDPAYTSSALYQQSALQVRIVVRYGSVDEARQYEFRRRPDFTY